MSRLGTAFPKRSTGQLEGLEKNKGIEARTNVCYGGFRLQQDPVSLADPDASLLYQAFDRKSFGSSRCIH